MLLEKHISPEPDAKVLVLFGGNPLRRDEIIRHLKTLSQLTIIGTLSEEEGLAVIRDLPKTDMVLIGGRYNAEQRERIKSYLTKTYPHIKVTEPGLDYPYEEARIIQTIREMMR